MGDRTRIERWMCQECVVTWLYEEGGYPLGRNASKGDSCLLRCESCKRETKHVCASVKSYPAWTRDFIEPQIAEGRGEPRPS